MIRSVIVFFGAAAVVLLPGAAQAQGTESPLGSCRVGRVENTGAFDSGSADRPGFYEGAVVITCDDSTLYADRVEWTATTVTATGHVLLQQPGLHVIADRIELNRATRYGTFYRAMGWARVSGSTQADRSPFGSFESDLMFSAEKVERTGPRTYRLTKGWYSTCAQPAPRWDFRITSGTIVLDERLVARNAVLRIKGVPVFYTPIIYYPLGSDERSTGILMPSYSTSSIHGSSISNAFFWVLGRSQDVTMYHNWFSKGGQGAGAEYRFVSGPGSDGQMLVTMFDNQVTAVRSYTVRGSVNQRLGRRFHLIGRSNYVTDQQTNQSFQQNLFDLSQRERYVGAMLAGGIGRYRVTATAEQRDYFDGLQSARRQGRAPSVHFAIGERPIGRSRISVGAASEAIYFVSQDDISKPETDRSLLRFDTAPTIRASLSTLSFLSMSTSATLRLTHWRGGRELLLDGGDPLPPVTRHLADLRADMTGPVFAKIWTPKENGYADRYKHLIEPRLSVSWLSAFDPINRGLENDHIDTMVGGTTTVTYGLVNRLLARRKTAAGKGAVRDVLSVSISQSRYSNVLAAAFDSQYQSRTSSRFSAVQITTTVRPGDGFNGRFQMYLDAKTRQVQTYSASASVGQSRSELTAGWSKRQFLPNVPGFDTPESASHFLNFSLTSRSSGGRVGGTYTANYDVGHRSLVQQRVVLHLNAQCCGVSVDYQTIRAAVSGTTVLPANRQFGISFSLAGLGSFSNPFGSFGDNSGRR